MTVGGRATRTTCCGSCSHLASGCSDLRAILHLDGADLLETLLGQVAALSEQVHPTALEVLELKEVYLGGRQNTSDLEKVFLVCRCTTMQVLLCYDGVTF